MGLADPGRPTSERLYAVVVPDMDLLRERKIVNAGDLIRVEMEGLAAGLPAHKRVLGYDIWFESLPRTRCPIRVAMMLAQLRLETRKASGIRRSPGLPPNVNPRIGAFGPGRRLARCHPVGGLGNAVHPANCRERPDHDDTRSPAKNRRDSSKRILAELRRTGLLRS